MNEREEKKTEFTSFRGKILRSFLLAAAPVILVLLVVNYYISSQNYDQLGGSLVEQAEDNIVNTVTIFDNGRKFFERSLEDPLRVAFDLFVEAYIDEGSNPDLLDLEALKIEIQDSLKMQLELYIVDSLGVVRYSTYPKDMNLDFSEKLPHLYSKFPSIRFGDQMVSNRIVSEVATGIERKFAYMPTPDNKYVLDIGIPIEQFPEVMPEIDAFTMASRLQEISPVLDSLRVFGKDNMYVMGRPGAMLDSATIDIINEIKISGTESVIVGDSSSGNYTKYVLVDLNDPSYSDDASKVVELSYNNNLVEDALNSQLLANVFVGFLGLGIISIVSLLVSKRIIKPIEELRSYVTSFSDDGSVSTEISQVSQSYDNDEIGQLSVAFSDMASKLEGAFTKLENANKDLDRLNKEKEVLIEMSRELSSGLYTSESAVLDIVFNEASKIIDTSNMYVALYDEDQELVRFPLMYRNGEKINVAPRVKGKGKTEEIINTRKPLLHKNRAASEAYYASPEREEYIDDPLASWMGVPMISGEKLVGVIAAFHPTKDDLYDEKDLRTLLAMADQTAIVLDNAKKLDGAQKEIADREQELVINGIAMDFIHTVNNLAGTIVPWTTLLKKNLGDEFKENEKAQKYIDYIIRDVSMILNEANKLRDPFVEPQKIDVFALLEDLVGQAIILSPDTEFDLENRTGERVYVFAQERQLSIAIFNLLENAIKAVDKSGEVQVLLYADAEKTAGGGNLVSIQIKDDGCGIEDEYRQSIFEYNKSFWKNKYRGTGYGLWRAKNILMNLKGDVVLEESRPGDGSIFKVSLPVV